MDLDTLIAMADGHLGSPGDRGQPVVSAPLPDLVLLRHTQPTTLQATLYEPLLCLILRGEKEITLGDRAVPVGPGQSVLVSHDLPVVSRITRASPDQPYLAVVLRLDLSLLRSLYDEVADALEDGPATSFRRLPASPTLLGALGRLLELAGVPVEARVLGPGVRRELHFRLLRELLRHDSHASHIGRAIAHIREHFRAPLAVPELARGVGMSASSFHKHFKAVTATTPLQYQKQLRLLEAHRLLSAEGQSVSGVAYAVGYESPSQFSREYTRKFGGPPSRDRAAAPD